MKRIAILTFLHAYNYGAELQCFALQYKLRLLKYKVEVIDLYRPLNKEFVKSNNYKQIFSFKDRRTLRKKINIFIMHSLGCLFRLIYRRRSKNRKRLFYEFHEMKKSSCVRINGTVRIMVTWHTATQHGQCNREFFMRRTSNRSQNTFHELVQIL